MYQTTKHWIFIFQRLLKPYCQKIQIWNKWSNSSVHSSKTVLKHEESVFIVLFHAIKNYVFIYTCSFINSTKGTSQIYYHLNRMHKTNKKTSDNENVFFVVSIKI